MRFVGKKAPDFSMVTTKNLETLEERATLADYAGKWLCLYFYPADFTFVCPTEITALDERYQEFLDMDCEVLGVSVDSIHSHRAWIRTDKEKGGLGSITHPLAADITKEVSRAYGVLLEDEGVALRGLFLIDPEGTVRYQVVHDNNIGRNVDEIIRVLEALQAGGLCAANWKPGQALLKG